MWRRLLIGGATSIRSADDRTSLARKVCAFVLRRDAVGPRLLVFSFASHPTLPRRVPGGTLAELESPLAGVQREVLEETGLGDLIVTRKLGVQRYYKPFIGSDVERHDYLLRAPESASSSFTHRVSGSGDDAGELFEYGWISREEMRSVDEEFRRYLTPQYLPEFFPSSCDDVRELDEGDAERVTIVEYDHSWPRRFDDQRTLLKEVFGDDVRVEHIGSTAVPGLGAKPILDIMIGVSALAEAEARVGQLAWLGYEYAPESEREVPQRRYFQQRIDGRRVSHLHCVVQGSEGWRRGIAFRDALRSDPATAGEYLALKKSLAARHGTDRVGYAAAKGPFIESVLHLWHAQNVAGTDGKKKQ